MRYKKTLVFSFMIFSLVLGLFNVKFAKGALTDISYTFNKEVFYQESNLLKDDSFNLANTLSYSDDYNSSYSFINETDNTLNTDIVYIDQTTHVGNSLIRINNSIDNHDKVLEMYDSGANEESIGWNYFTASQTSGTFELWFTTTEASSASSIILFDGANVRLHLIIANDLFQYHNGVGAQSTGIACLDDTWYHIRIDFECGGGGYLGLASDTFYYNINQVQYGAYIFRSNTVNVDRMRLGTDTSADATIFSNYYDGIGYSWLSNYTIGENSLPIYTENNDLVVDKFHFDMTDVNTYVVLASSNPQGWSDIEIGGGDLVKVGMLGVPYSSRAVVIQCHDLGDQRGIFDDNLYITSNFVNITFNFIIETLDGINALTFFELYDDNDDIITALLFSASGNLYYRDGIDWSSDYTLLEAGITTNVYYEFNLLLNYERNLGILRTERDGILNGVYDFPLLEIGKKGLGKVNITSLPWNDDLSWGVDAVGIYDEGVPYTEDLGWYSRDMNVVDSLIVERSNILEVNSSGLFAIGSVQDLYTIGETYQILESFYTHTSYNVTNIFDIYSNTIPNPTLVVTLNNESILADIYYLSLEGVSLTEGINTYWLEFTHSGINPSESFFYVDNENRLQFSLITDDTNLEYIQAEFNIIDTLSDDFAIEFRSNIDNKAYGYFRVNFTDVSNFIPIPIFDKTSRVLLSQNKTISSFIILITDENIDSVLGLTEGYVSDVNLLFIAGVGVSIITSNLLTIIIPLIIIFIPTFLLASKVGKNMIVPLMMLMSLICVATEIIPIWLFFVIIFPSSLFLFLKRKELMI